MSVGRKKIAYYLRHCGNTHYFASIKPYLDYFLRRGGCRNHIVVRELGSEAEQLAEYAGYRHLFTADADLSQYDLVLTPTHLRDNEIDSRERAVQIFHGISDKPFTYERDLSGYALCLCAGQRQVDRLLRHEHNRGMRRALVGYPKFDRIAHAPPLFDNGKKTVIYSPTWRKGGLSSVERFLDRPPIIEAIATKYNLIVKPHPNIFNSAREHFDAKIVERLEALPHIKLVRAGNVMPWFAQADLFVGDISASGYEWLYFGRPAVFLNPQPGVLQTNASVDAPTYLWQCGGVCDEVGELRQFIDRGFRDDAYRTARESVLHYSVHQPRGQTATARGVAVIEALLHNEAPLRCTQ